MLTKQKHALQTHMSNLPKALSKDLAPLPVDIFGDDDDGGRNVKRSKVDGDYDIFGDLK